MEIILLVGHGSPEKEADSTGFVAERVHEMLHPSCSKNCVRAAYLQFMDPGLPEAIKNAVSDGADKIIIHPFLLSSGFHVTKNIPEIIKEVRSLYRNVDIIYTEPLGSHDKLAEVVVERIKESTDLEDES